MEELLQKKKEIGMMETVMERLLDVENRKKEAGKNRSKGMRTKILVTILALSVLNLSVISPPVQAAPLRPRGSMRPSPRQ